MVKRLVGAPGIVRGAAHARRPRSKRDSRTPARLDRAVAMQSGESIYNLIPQPEVVPARPPCTRASIRARLTPATSAWGEARERHPRPQPGRAQTDTSERFLRKKNPEDTLRSRASNGPPDLPPGPAARDYSFADLDALARRSKPPRPRPAHIPPPSVNDHTDRAPVAGTRCRRRCARSPPRVSPFPATRVADPPPAPLQSFARRDSELHRRRREKSMTKPAVPKATERPVMGLVSQKNFVKANAIENILAKPEKREEPPRDAEGGLRKGSQVPADHQVADRRRTRDYRGVSQATGGGGARHRARACPRRSATSCWWSSR